MNEWEKWVLSTLQNQAIFIFHLSRKSLIWGNWVAVVRGNNSMPIRRTTKLSSSILSTSEQMLKQKEENPVYWPSSPALLYIFVFWTCAERKTLTKSFADDSALLSFYFELMCCWRGGMGNHLTQAIPVLDLVRSGSSTMSAVLCWAMGLAGDMNSTGDNWMLGQRCKTGSVCGGTRITGRVAFAHGKDCTGTQLNAQHL